MAEAELSQPILRTPPKLARLREPMLSGRDDGTPRVDDVSPKVERDEFMARYKQAVGLVIEVLDAVRPMITPRGKGRRGLTLRDRLLLVPSRWNRPILDLLFFAPREASRPR